MNKLISKFLILAALFAMPSLAQAHGGTYIPPGDVVPPGGTGSQPPSPTPASPPSEPTGPITPPNGNPPTTGGPPTGPITPPNQPQGAEPVKTAASIPPDLGQWTFWWELNKDHYLNLKAKVRSKSTITDSGVLIGLGSGARHSVTSGPTAQDIQTRIVPALLQLLETEDNRDILTGAMVALGRIGVDPEGVITALEKKFSASSQEVRETAALSLGILRRPEAIPTLEAIAWDEPAGRALVNDTRVDLRTRVFALYGLGLIGQASTDPEVKDYLGGRALQMLMEDESALKDLRVAAALSLGRIQPPQPELYLPALQDMLAKESQDSLVLAHLPKTMAHLLQRVPADDLLFAETTKSFLAQLDGRRPARWLSRSLVQALGVMAKDHPEAGTEWTRLTHEGLSKAMRDSRDHQTRAFSAISLAYLGASSEEVREDVIQTLIRGMDKMSTPLRPWCALALGVLSFELKEKQVDQYAPLVTSALRERFDKVKSPERRGAYAIALGLCEDYQALESLKLAIADSRENTFRGYCAVAVGLIATPDESAILVELSEDAKRDMDLMRQANIGLGLLGDSTAVKALVQRLRPENGKPLRLSTLASIANALGFIGDRSAVGPLLEAIHDERLTPLGRAFAVVALGMVADQSTMPWRSHYSVDLNYLAGVSTLLDPSSGTGLLDIL